MLKDKIIEHLKLRIDNLKESIRSMDSIIIKQQNRIRELEEYLSPPQYKHGDIVNIIGEGHEQYLIEACTAYTPEYCLKSIRDNTIRESIIELDIVDLLND